MLGIKTFQPKWEGPGPGVTDCISQKQNAGGHLELVFCLIPPLFTIYVETLILNFKSIIFSS